MQIDSPHPLRLRFSPPNKSPQKISAMQSIDTIGIRKRYIPEKPRQEHSDPGFYLGGSGICTAIPVVVSPGTLIETLQVVIRDQAGFHIA